MKIDPKNLIIFLLTGIILFLGGYILGGKNNPSPSTSLPQHPAMAKEYKDLVAKDIRAYSEQMSACYRDFLKTKPDVLEGKVDLVFKVQNNGVVDEIDIAKNEMGSTELENCIKKQLAPLRLKPLPAGLNPYVSHSLVFKSEETLKKEAEEQKNRIPKILPVD